MNTTRTKTLTKINIRLPGLQGPILAHLWAEMPPSQVPNVAEQITRAFAAVQPYGENSNEFAGCIAEVGERIEVEVR